MGGNFIGSHLVELSTGIDYVKAVIEVAMGVKPQIEPRCQRVAAVCFIFGEADAKVFERLMAEHPEYDVAQDMHEISENEVVDSSRFGYYMMVADVIDQLVKYMP